MAMEDKVILIQSKSSNKTLENRQEMALDVLR